MILNVFTVASLFLAALGLVLALAAALAGARAWRRSLGAPDAAGRDAAEERAHLVFLLIAVLAGVRALSWPLFQGVLTSYVEELRPAGAMCAYGVAHLSPVLVPAVHVAKAALLWSAALWLALALADRKSTNAPFVRLRLLAAVPLAVLAALEAALESAYLLGDKLDETVTCCSQILASASSTGGVGAPAAWFAGPLAFTLVNALALGAASVARWRGVARGTTGAAAALALALLALLNLVVTEFAWAESLAPHVLGLPYHRCLYEALAATPGLAVAAGLAVAGNGALALPIALQLFRARAPDAIGDVQRGVCAFAALAIGSEGVLVAAHWL